MSTTDLPSLSPRMYEVLCRIVESEAPYRVYSAIVEGTEADDRAFDVEVKALRAYFEQRGNRNAPNHGGDTDRFLRSKHDAK